MDYKEQIEKLKDDIREFVDLSLQEKYHYKPNVFVIWRSVAQDIIKFLKQYKRFELNKDYIFELQSKSLEFVHGKGDYVYIDIEIERLLNIPHLTRFRIRLEDSNE